MKFGISLESDTEARSKSMIIRTMSNSLEEYLNNRDYGEGIQTFYIGCICIRTVPGYEEWYKIRKPRYKELLKFKTLDNKIAEIKCYFGYDIKMDYEPFLKATDEGSRKMLAQEILKSLSNFDKLPKKVKDFDKERFKADIEQFFRELDLI